MKLRRARADDVPAVEQLVRRAYTMYIERMGREPGPMGDDYRQKLHSAAVYVADPGELVGMIVLIAGADHVLIENIAVDPAHQHRGVGRLLMTFAETFARAAGLSELRLYTHARMRENLDLYPRRGYARVGRRTEDGFDRVYFSKRLSASLPITTERLLIRPLTPADADAMHAVFSDPCVMRHVPGGPRDRNGTLLRLDALIEHQRTHGFSKWALVDRSDQEVVGDCGVQLLDGGPSIELGFHLRRDRWGHGYATEAARACFAWALMHRPEPLVAIVEPANTRSVRVLQNIGMSRSGTYPYLDRVWDLYVPEPHHDIPRAHDAAGQSGA